MNLPLIEPSFRMRRIVLREYLFSVALAAIIILQMRKCNQKIKYVVSLATKPPEKSEDLTAFITFHYFGRRHTQQQKWFFLLRIYVDTIFLRDIAYRCAF